MVRGQVGIEYLIITGFLLVAVGVLFAVSFTYYLNANESQLARTAVDTMVSASDQAAGLGDGTVVFAIVELPSNVSLVSANGKEINVAVNSRGFVTDYYAESKADINAISFIRTPPGPGKHYMRFSYAGGTVTIGESP